MHISIPVVALTGAIASGKSSCARSFAALGVPCLDIDIAARTIHQDPAHPATRAVAAAFPQAMTADGRLARGSLRSVFAQDSAANERLKRILRPHVLEVAAAWTATQQAPYVMWETALAADLPPGCARVLVVDAPDEVRLARLAVRNPDWTREQALAVIALQPSRSAYLAGADDVIVNDGPPHLMAALAEALHRRYLTLWSPA